MDDVVNETVDIIKNNEGIGNAFDPKSYVYLTVNNIIASSAFGKRQKFLFNRIIIFIFLEIYKKTFILRES